MANTSNFGWETPDDTDLVKDGALAMRTLGNAIDTSMGDLRGGTSGQILAKNSNTDMDFVWITNDQGDITEVAAGVGISGGGASGAVTITNSMATAIDAKGDLIVGTGADTFSRLAVGTNNQYLVADSATATGLKWATLPSSGKVLQVVYATTTTQNVNTTTNYADTNLSASITPSATNSKILILVNQQQELRRSAIDQGGVIRILRNSTTIYEPGDDPYNFNYLEVTGATAIVMSNVASLTYLDSPNTTSSITYKTQHRPYLTTNSGRSAVQWDGATSSMLLMEIGA